MNHIKHSNKTLNQCVCVGKAVERKNEFIGIVISVILLFFFWSSIFRKFWVNGTLNQRKNICFLVYIVRERATCLFIFLEQNFEIAKRFNWCSENESSSFSTHFEMLKLIAQTISTTTRWWCWWCWWFWSTSHYRKHNFLWYVAWMGGERIVIENERSVACVGCRCVVSECRKRSQINILDKPIASTSQLKNAGKIPRSNRTNSNRSQRRYRQR